MYPMLLHHHQIPLGSVWVVSLHMTKLPQQMNVADCLLTTWETHSLWFVAERGYFVLLTFSQWRYVRFQPQDQYVPHGDFQ